MFLCRILSGLFEGFIGISFLRVVPYIPEEIGYLLIIVPGDLSGISGLRSICRHCVYDIIHISGDLTDEPPQLHLLPDIRRGPHQETQLIYRLRLILRKPCCALYILQLIVCSCRIVHIDSTVQRRRELIWQHLNARSILSQVDIIRVGPNSRHNYSPLPVLMTLREVVHR